ncbi:hypothetical protein BJ996_000323 [Streptomyces phaeogriseichromatogenes]|nr:hypothetical protein [Streptomyces murinus]
METSATEAPFITTTRLGAFAKVSFTPQLSRVTGYPVAEAAAFVSVALSADSEPHPAVSRQSAAARAAAAGRFIDMRAPCVRRVPVGRAPMQ